MVFNQLGLPWNEFLAQDPARTWPVLHNVMAFVPQTPGRRQFSVVTCSKIRLMAVFSLALGIQGSWWKAPLERDAVP